VNFPSGTKAGETFSPKVQCPNPDHDTLKRHFQVNLTEPKVHCFAHCGISGSYEHAVCVIEGLYEKFKVDQQAVRDAFDKHPAERTANEREQLRRRERAIRQAKKLILTNAKPSNFTGKPRVRKKVRGSGTTPAVSTDALSYERYLPQLALNYIEKRGLSDSAVAKWEFGWLPDEKRLVIPARDLDGKLRFLIKRGVLEKTQPKYLYTEGFPKTSLLFGACYIDLGLVHSDGLIVVEGSLDTIAFHQHGLSNTGGILGTGISDEQVRIIAKLRPPKIILAFDRDAAGIRNIEIASRKLRKYPLYVMRYPSGKNDPQELSEKEAKRQISRAVPLSVFNRKAQRRIPNRKVIHG
jgi:5S rRNA maturation endonuclease (ribonuclease M5)